MEVALVTGAGGFVGKHLIEQIQENDKLNGTDTLIIAVDYSNPNAFGPIPLGKICDTTGHYVYVDLCEQKHVNMLLSFLEDNNLLPDIIYHFAGNPSVSSCEKHPMQALKINTLVTQQLLQSFCHDKCKFVFASSATVYSNESLQRKDGCDETGETKPCSIYGISKLASEHLVKHYTNNHIIIRYSAIVGGGAKHGVVPDIVRKLKLDTPTLTLIGNAPGTIKQYIHVGDVVKITTKLANQERACGTFNLGSLVNDKISIMELALIVQDAVNITKPIEWHPQIAWPGDNPIIHLLSNKIWSYINDGTIKQYTSNEAVFCAAQEISETL